VPLRSSEGGISSRKIPKTGGPTPHLRKVVVALMISCSGFMVSGCGCTNTVAGAAGGEILTCSGLLHEWVTS
jgi:hypothetical protein